MPLWLALLACWACLATGLVLGGLLANRNADGPIVGDVAE